MSNELYIKEYDLKIGSKIRVLVDGRGFPKGSIIELVGGTKTNPRFKCSQTGRETIFNVRLAPCTGPQWEHVPAETQNVQGHMNVSGPHNDQSTPIDVTAFAWEYGECLVELQEMDNQIKELTEARNVQYEKLKGLEAKAAETIQTIAKAHKFKCGYNP